MNSTGSDATVATYLMHVVAHYALNSSLRTASCMTPRSRSFRVISHFLFIGARPCSAQSWAGGCP